MRPLLLALLLLLAVFAAVAAAQTALEAPPEVQATRDVVYATREVGGDLKLDVYVPHLEADERPPLVVWIHGGGWSGGDKTWLPMLFLTERGYAVASVQYRFTQVATFPAQIDDCRDALRFLRDHADEYGYDASRIGVMGESAGGHLAALLATTGAEHDVKPAALLDFYGPHDLTRPNTIGDGPTRAAYRDLRSALLGGDPESDPAARERAERASPVTFVDAGDPPTLVVHGTQDTLVPPEQATLFVDALHAANVKADVLFIEGAGHAGAAFWTPELHDRYAAFLDQVLRDEAAATQPADASAD